MNKVTKRVSHEKVEKKMLKNPAVKAEFDRLMENFDIESKLIEARLRAHKTQADVADFMETTASVIARIEAGGGKAGHSPSLITLQKYAAAVGCELDIKLKPIKMPNKLVALKHRKQTVEKHDGRSDR